MSFNPHQWYLMGLSQSISTVKHLTLSTTSTSATWSPQTVTNTGATLTWDVTGDITPTSQNVNDPTFDLSANTGTVYMNVYDVSNLIDLIFPANIGITSIDISKALALSFLQLDTSSISSFDFSKNINLVTLLIPRNPIGTINISANVNLFSLNVGDCGLTNLDTSANVALNNLTCWLNPLTSLNISTLINLTSLSCQICSIASLDLTNNTNLTTVRCEQNNMIPSATDQIYIDLDVNGQSNGILHIRNNRTSASDTARATLVSRGWTFNESYTT